MHLYRSSSVIWSEVAKISSIFCDDPSYLSNPWAPVVKVGCNSKPTEEVCHLYQLYYEFTAVAIMRYDYTLC